MPTYDYRCKDCGHEFEIHQSFSEDALTVCPNCQGDLRKVFSAVGISFKGSGFYKTDSRGGGSASKSSSASTSTTPSSDSGSSTSSDSGSSSSSDSSSSSSTPATPASTSPASST
ncbi:MAG TPA: zinc ribbon domain-containing protein [Microthrixaceae bacterium]|nr:zinc ribbon domain-containing protein [Microthrixaceae bacterium]